MSPQILSLVASVDGFEGRGHGARSVRLSRIGYQHSGGALSLRASVRLLATCAAWCSSHNLRGPSNCRDAVTTIELEPCNRPAVAQIGTARSLFADWALSLPALELSLISQTDLNIAKPLILTGLAAKVFGNEEWRSTEEINVAGGAASPHYY